MKHDYIDIHSHISFPQFDDDRDEVFERMCDAKTSTITVSVDFESSKRAVEVAEQYKDVYATIGLHPADNKKESFDAKEYASLVENKKVVAVGECGLDYFRIDNSDETEKERQRVEFSKQIEFAMEHNLPLMIHGRPSQETMDAYEDILLELTPFKGQVLGNIHFFVGTEEVARKFFDLGFTLSFSGVITFTNEYDELIKNAPLEMLMSETDSPYATPVPHRGKRNEPSYVSIVTEKIADIRGEGREKVLQQILQNAEKVFGISDK